MYNKQTHDLPSFAQVTYSLPILIHAGNDLMRLLYNQTQTH